MKVESGRLARMKGRFRPYAVNVWLKRFVATAAEPFYFSTSNAGGGAPSFRW